MSKVQNYKLVEGQFSPSDATNILFALFNSKINFHQLESFRIQERNFKNRDNIKHEERVEELKDAYKVLKALINDASDENMDLEIHGTIILKPVVRIPK
ncbi:MAG: hypothetical protein IPL10_04995 [Bacteroidetes bacterium]|nr:hypothetical protein [Bacteroidota bacterium]